jgi:hypothetical protein
MSRRHNFQTVSWFYDLHVRNLLDLDPPYQRRSVWNQEFKDYFVDTVLLNLPAPAIFLYEDITPDGRSVYHVVDGKQRLTSLFEFIRGEFPVSSKSEAGSVRDKYFQAMDDSTKKSFWAYQFLVEYVPSDDEKLINGIFDRINRNVAKLTPQELRHARLDGEFISAAESLAEWTESQLPRNFPRFAHQSRKQMKDVELVALLLLLIEAGPHGYSQDDLDAAFTARDSSWDQKIEVENEYRSTVTLIASILAAMPDHRDLAASRLRNQADYYSFFGAILDLHRAGTIASPLELWQRLHAFVDRVEDEQERAKNVALADYYEAARSASNDRGARERRIKYMKKILDGRA